jgi:hypothetical protein
LCSLMLQDCSLNDDIDRVAAELAKGVCAPRIHFHSLAIA